MTVYQNNENAKCVSNTKHGNTHTDKTLKERKRS